MVTIYSPGEYASRFSPEEYIRDNVESEIRDPTIAKILYLNKSIEQFGSGFKRIDSLCRDANIKYSYENRGNGFKLIIYRPALAEENADFSLSGVEASVLALLRQNNGYSREELASKVSKSTRTVQRALNSLRDKGYIKRRGRKKDKTWDVVIK